MSDKENSFNFNDDDNFGEFSTEMRNTETEEQAVAPAGYSVPERFKKRESHNVKFRLRTGKSEASGSAQALYSPLEGYGASVAQQIPTRQLNADTLTTELELPDEAAQTLNASQKEPEVSEEQAYVPPMPKGYEKVDEVSPLRIRFRTRNKRPLSFAVKAGITAAVMALLFVALSFSIYAIIIGARVNRIAAGSVSTVRISAADREKITAEETAEETDVAAFTQPDLLHGSSKDIDLILVIGSDNLNGENSPCTTNAMVLAAIDHKNKELKLVYLSTDLYVRIPGYYPNTLDMAYYYDTANGLDDLPTTMSCVQDNFGVTLDGFVVVDYLAFQTVVERLGGVVLTLSDEEAQYMSSHWKYGIFKRFSSGGLYTMSAAETLNYIRIKDVGDGYLDRVNRQQLVFSYLLENAKSRSELELSAIAFDVLPMCSTSLSAKQARQIISKAAEILDYGVFRMQAPVSGAWRFGIAETGNGAKTVVVTSYKFTAEAIQTFIYQDNMEYAEDNTVTGVVLPESAPAPVEETGE